VKDESSLRKIVSADTGNDVQCFGFALTIWYADADSAFIVNADPYPDPTLKMNADPDPGKRIKKLCFF
jgi:alpha-glucosidase (family GH31 glycosyl hydrolase)